MQEAFWGDYLDGAKRDNRWAAHVATERLPTAPRPRRIFLGLHFGTEIAPIDLGRPLLVRFGEIARLESVARDLRVTLRDGDAFVLDRLGASDLDDGLRVWDGRRGVVDLGPWDVRAIDFLPTPRLGDAPRRLYGTLRTLQGDFTGFVAWQRHRCFGSDPLVERRRGDEPAPRFAEVRAIARRPDGAADVALADGREIVVEGAGSDWIYVEDPRFGRVRVAWNELIRAELQLAASSGPAYGDFAARRPLAGAVTTRDGRHLAGRLVYDLDESATTDTLDGSVGGLHHTIPFAAIAAIAPFADGGGEGAAVTLRGGERLRLTGTGDVGPGHAGVLVFVAGREQPEYVRWSDVERLELEQPAATLPPP